MRRICLVLLFVLLAVACGREQQPSAEDERTESPSPSPAVTTEPPGGAGPTEQRPAPSPVPSEVAQGDPLEPEAMKPTESGTYLYDETGTRKLGGCGADGPPPSPTSLTVDPPNGNRQRSVRDRRFPNGQGEVTTSIFEFRRDGIYLAYLLQEQYSPLGKNTTEFSPSEPILVFPEGGGAQSWSFSMTSTDGKARFDAQNTIESRDEAVTTGDGETVSTVRVKRTARITGQSIAGEVNLTEDSVSWISTSHRLILKQVTDTRGTIGTCQVETHVEALIRST